MIDASQPQRWTATPAVPEGLTGGSSTPFAPAARTALAALVAAAAPSAYVYTALGGVSAALVVAVALAAGSVLGGFVAQRWWASRVLIWLAAAIVVDLAGAGEEIALWSVAWLVLAHWAVRLQPPIPGLPAPTDAVPIVVLAAVASYQAYQNPWAHLFYVTTAFAVAVALAQVVFGASLQRVAAAVGRWASTAVSGVCLFAIALLVVVLPWAVQRLFRLDPLAARARPGWNYRGRGDPQPRRMWMADPAPQRMPLWQRTRWVIAMPLTLLVLAAGWFELRNSEVGRAAGFGVEAPAAMADSPWWWGYQVEAKRAFENGGATSNPWRFPPMRDIEGRYINVENGSRVTWRGPECACRRLRLWMYGGSTMVGLGQRDDHTIPSEFARYASSRGVTVDVTNRGVMGNLNWEESERAAWDLTSEPPDMVIFYDGFNDLWASQRSNLDRDSGYLTDWPSMWPRDEPRGGGEAPLQLEPEELARSTVAKYERGRLAVAALARDQGLPVAWFWQPDLYTKRPAPGEPRQNGSFEKEYRRLRLAAGAILPADVRDVSDVFDSIDAPIFYDEVHTNELGARLIAERMFDELEPVIRSVEARR